MIDTERLRLRPLTPDDAPHLAHLTSPAVSRWTGSWPPQLSEEAALERVAAAGAAIDRGDAAVWAITLREDDGPLGVIGLHLNASNRRSGELGFWIGEAFWGRGYAAEAARAVVAHGFETTGLDVIEAGAKPKNARSIAVLTKLGMTPCGGRRVYASARHRHEACRFFRLSRPGGTRPPSGSTPGSLPATHAREQGFDEGDLDRPFADGRRLGSDFA